MGARRFLVGGPDADGRRDAVVRAAAGRLRAVDGGDRATRPAWSRRPRSSSTCCPYVLLFGLGISLVVAPLTSTLMGSISGRFSGLGSAINNSIARVGQPLLGAIIFIAISAIVLRVARLGGRAGHEPTRRSGRRSSHSTRRRRRATADQIAGRRTRPRWMRSTWRCSACAGLLAIGGARVVVRAARGPVASRRPRNPRRPPHDDEAMTRDWDARTYDRVADPQTRWGTAVLDRLPLDGDERVLDAGCGSGRVTELLAERLPRGRVVALDGSPSMVDAARERLAPFGDRIEYVVADLGAAAADRRAGRRDPVDRDVPLGPRPRRAVPEPGRRAATGRLARRPMRRRRQHRRRSSGCSRRSATAGSAPPITRRRWRPSAGSTRPASSTSSAG